MPNPEYPFNFSTLPPYGDQQQRIVENAEKQLIMKHACGYRCASMFVLAAGGDLPEERLTDFFSDYKDEKYKVIPEEQGTPIDFVVNILNACFGEDAVDVIEPASLQDLYNALDNDRGVLINIWDVRGGYAKDDPTSEPGGHIVNAVRRIPLYRNGKDVDVIEYIEPSNIMEYVLTRCDAEYLDSCWYDEDPDRPTNHFMVAVDISQPRFNKDRPPLCAIEEYFDQLDMIDNLMTEIGIN